MDDLKNIILKMHNDKINLSQSIDKYLIPQELEKKQMQKFQHLIH
jgi:hypothetical protein